MTDREISPDVDRARQLLDQLWSSVSREADAEIDPDIDRLINSPYVSIRFCLPTQLLGKLTDPRLDCLCLQKGTSTDESHWDPRSFANKVIVPWVAENQSVLGTSSDPYVSKPLRRPRLEENPGNVKGAAEWELLYGVLHEVQQRNSKKFTRQRTLSTLRSIHKKFSDLTFEYIIPQRINLDQTHALITRFLSESSGGDRGLSVAAALFETFGKFFGVYREVRRQAINAPDLSTGLAGDIECIGEDGQIKLVVEVKERNLTLTDVRSAILKARRVSLRELLFTTPGTEASQEELVADLISTTWASGTNLYRLSIDELIKVGLSLTGDAGRQDFLSNIGRQLDIYSTQPINRKRWKELLENI